MAVAIEPDIPEIGGQGSIVEYLKDTFGMVCVHVSHHEKLEAPMLGRKLSNSRADEAIRCRWSAVHQNAMRAIPVAVFQQERVAVTGRQHLYAQCLARQLSYVLSCCVRHIMRGHSLHSFWSQSITIR